MAKLSASDAEQRLKISEGLEARRQSDQEAVHVRWFPEAVAFVDRLVPEAEAADHHPDILINYKRVTLTYSTHSEGGLTDKDFAGAAMADRRCRCGSNERTARARSLRSPGSRARQLQIWDAGGLLSPAIPPHRTAAGGYTERRYTPIELFELLVLADLRRRGFTVHQLHAMLDALEIAVRDAAVRSDRRRRRRCSC